MKKNHEEVWYLCLQIIKDNIPESSYSTWFKPIVPHRLEQNILTIQVPSTFFYEYLEEHFIDLLKKALRKILGSEAKLEYTIVLDNSFDSDNKSPVTVKYPSGNGTDLQNSINYKNETPTIKNPFIVPGLKKPNINPQLNPILTFENYIEGDCNKLARSAGKAIAAKPGGTSFNPMFIHGQSGMGKTHLAHAIGIEVKENFPDKIVLVVSANDFQTQFTDAAKNNNRNDFLHFYKIIDVLIIDDVHEFAGKSATQDTYFHIFNHLHQSGKQIVLTSDRPPSELKGLNERLISRFKWGLTAEIQAPDEETRKSIIKRKAYHDGINLDNNVIDHLAQNLNGSVRELEGAIVSLLAQKTLIKQDITLDLAQSTTDRYHNKPKSEITIPYIVKIVCDYFSLQVSDLSAKSRKREYVQARQLAMYFAKKYTKASLSAIGAEIGGKDHSTVLHANKQIDILLESDKLIKNFVDDLNKKILFQNN